MIRINLAKKKKSGGAGAKIDIKNLDLSTLIDFFKNISSGSATGGEEKNFDLKNSPLAKAIIALLACYIVQDTLTGYKTDILKKIDKDISIVEKETDGVQKKLSQVKGFEVVKHQLEEDQRTLRTKLQVIDELLENRNAPTKLMLQLANSIPEEVWLTDLKVTEDSLVVSGATSGYNQVSDFLKSLNDSSLFANISLKGIEESSSSTKDERIQMFEIDATRRKLHQ